MTIELTFQNLHLFIVRAEEAAVTNSNFYSLLHLESHSISFSILNLIENGQ